MIKSTFLKTSIMLVVGVVMLGSCLKTETPAPPPPSFVMSIVNAYTDTAGIKPQINGKNIFTGPMIYKHPTQPSLNSNVSIAQFYSSQVGVQPGSNKYSTLSSNQNQLLIQEFEKNTEENKFYSWFIYGKKDEAKTLFIEDVMIKEDENKLRFRFLNLANDSGPVDFYLGEQMVAQSRNQETNVSIVMNGLFESKSIPAGTNIIVKKSDGSNKVIAEYKSFNFTQARPYNTIILVGDKEKEDSKVGQVYDVRVCQL